MALRRTEEQPLFAAFPMPCSAADYISSDQAGSIVETDCRYFELGAEEHRIPGAQWLYMPGLEFLCSASAIQRVRPELIDMPFATWLDRAEREARRLRLSHVRMYLLYECADWKVTLQHRGYRRKVEFLLRQDVSDFETDHLHLVPVDTPEAWHSRVTLFQHDRKGMDGHDLLPVAWNELERRKAATGELHCLTAIHHDRCVGAVSFMRTRHFLRVKNLFVHPLHRRQGVAMAMLKWMHEQARLLHMRSVCLMAVDGSPAIDLYRLMGMEIVGEQYEWIKPIDPG